MNNRKLILDTLVKRGSNKKEVQSDLEKFNDKTINDTLDFAQKFYGKGESGVIQSYYDLVDLILKGKTDR